MSSTSHSSAAQWALFYFTHEQRRPPIEGGWKYRTKMIAEKAAVAEASTSWRLVQQFSSVKFQTGRCRDVDYILSLLAGLDWDKTFNPDILSQAGPTPPACRYSMTSAGRGKIQNTQALQIAFTEQCLSTFGSVQQDKLLQLTRPKHDMIS